MVKQEGDSERLDAQSERVRKRAIAVAGSSGDGGGAVPTEVVLVKGEKRTVEDAGGVVAKARMPSPRGERRAHGAEEEAPRAKARAA